MASLKLSEDSSRRKLNGKQYCIFCGLESNILYGKFFTSNELDMSVHQYCMFFASGLAQNGNDNEGFDGFLPEDIRREVCRGKRLKCSFCHKNGATVGCAVHNCKIKYHYPCGKQNETLEQFFGRFDAFCKRHKPLQKLPKENWKHLHCAICLELLLEEGSVGDFLKMPCCIKNYMHKDCLQRHASFSGYFCTCPMCKNCDKFQLEMKIHGIFIPERDALWEEGNAFADLLEVYNRCDCKYCYCLTGRDFVAKSGRWRMYRCQVCGHSASHRMCAESEGKHFSPFKCDNCITLEVQTRFREKIEQETRSCAVSLPDIGASIVEGKISYADAKDGVLNVIQLERSHSLESLTNVLDYKQSGRLRSSTEARGKRNAKENLCAEIGGIENRQESAALSPINLKYEYGKSKGNNNRRCSLSLSDKRLETNKLQLKSALFKYIENALKTKA